MKAAINKEEDNQAYCTPCRIALRAHKGDLTKHHETEKHVRNMDTVDVNKQATIESLCNVTHKKEKKIRDLTLAACIAAHIIIITMDHLNEILKKIFPSLNMYMHRTKCTNLITNVKAPNFSKDLIADIGDSYFFLLVDESTDVSDSKYLMLFVKYFLVTAYVVWLPITLE